MDFKEYGKWLAVGLFGFMGLSWDAIFFLTMILGNGTATISEPNPIVIWCEFIAMTLLAAFVLVVTVKHLVDTINAKRVKVL